MLDLTGTVLTAVLGPAASMLGRLVQLGQECHPQVVAEELAKVGVCRGIQGDPVERF